jgi:hypothetical protein
LRGRESAVKWVEKVRMKDDGTTLARCRSVGKEIDYYARDDVDDGTPPLSVIGMAATTRRRGPRDRKIAPHDAEVGFFHATPDEWICIPRPPAGTAPPGWGWQLWKALDGTRQASQLWAEYVAAMFNGVGIPAIRTERAQAVVGPPSPGIPAVWSEGAKAVVGPPSPNTIPGMYVKKDPELVRVVHGGDFATVGDDEALDHLDEVQQGSIMIKRLGRVRPGGACSGPYLRRRIELRYPRHSQDIVQVLGLEKGQETPGIEATGASAAEESKPLSAPEGRPAARAIGSGRHLATDRPEIQCAAECLTCFATERHYIIQAESEAGVLPGYSDSDWAADVAAKRSTSGHSTFHGKHLACASSARRHNIAVSSGEAELYACGRVCATVLTLLYHTIKKVGLLRRAPSVYMDNDVGRRLATRTAVGKQRHIQTEWLWLQERVRGGELQVRCVDGEQSGSGLGTRHLDARGRDYLMNHMGSKRGRRHTSSMWVAMVACLGRAADAAGEIALPGQLTDDSISMTCIIRMTLVILAMVGSHTLWRAAFPVTVVQVGRRSVGTQTGEEVPASDAPTAVPSSRPFPSTAQLESYAVYQLKSMCRDRGLSVAGLKRDHVLRLEQYGR